MTAAAFGDNTATPFTGARERGDGASAEDEGAVGCGQARLDLGEELAALQVDSRLEPGQAQRFRVITL